MFLANLTTKNYYKFLKNLNGKWLMPRGKSTAATHILLNPEFSKETIDDVEWNSAIPYDRVPGPSSIPILGNNWRFLPIIGKTTINLFKYV